MAGRQVLCIWSGIRLGKGAFDDVKPSERANGASRAPSTTCPRLPGLEK